MTDTTTLPKWAQQYMCQYIHKLEQDVEYWKHAATAGPEESDTFIVQHGGASDTPLGTGVTVRFKLGNNDRDGAEVRNMGDGTMTREPDLHRFDASLRRAEEAADDHAIYMTSMYLVNDPAQHRTEIVAHNHQGYAAHCGCGWTFDAREVRA